MHIKRLHTAHKISGLIMAPALTDPIIIKLSAKAEHPISRTNELLRKLNVTVLILKSIHNNQSMWHRTLNQMAKALLPLLINTSFIHQFLQNRMFLIEFIGNFSL